MDFEKLGEAAFNARYPATTTAHPRFWSEIDNKDRHINVAKAVIEASGLLPELTTLRERVRELEAELFDSEDRRKCWVLAHEGLEGRLANWIKAHTELEQEYEKVCTSNHSLEKEVAELRHKVKTLESTHNRKGPKFVEGFKVEEVKPSKFSVQTCQGCGDTPLTTAVDWKNGFVNKCIKCGRVL